MEEVEVLHHSERGRVVLVRDAETGKRYVRKELQGQYLVYTQLRTLAHPYLPRIEEVTLEEDRTVILEEYIEGVTLDRASLSQGQLTRLLLELCNVLEFLHGHGILHRDIKPSNLMLAADGHLRLIDFDAARQERETAEQDTRLLGTRGYAPPEQYGFAQTDARTDIYAMGVTFRQLLGPLARKRRWKKLLRKCTALDPKDRYHSASQVRRAIWRGRAKRWLLRPILLLIGLRILYYVAILSYGFATDGEMRETFHYLLFEMEWFDRPRIFSTVDIDKLKEADWVRHRRFTGELAPYIAYLEEKLPKQTAIFTGYEAEPDWPIFGVFELEHSYRTGEYRYGHFLGLVVVSPEGEMVCIPAKDCGDYPTWTGPLILALYDLDVFDTPIF